FQCNETLSFANTRDPRGTVGFWSRRGIFQTADFAMATSIAPTLCNSAVPSSSSLRGPAGSRLERRQSNSALLGLQSRTLPNRPAARDNSLPVGWWYVRWIFVEMGPADPVLHTVLIDPFPHDSA